MGLDIVLHDEHGKRIDEISDLHDALRRLIPSASDQTFRCLGFIDLYGDTVFKRVQMEAFLTELRRVRHKAGTEEERHVLDRIEGLARRCQAEPHLYLKIYGD